MIQTSISIANIITLLVMAVLLITGIVLMARGRRIHGSAAMIGLAGCVLLLLGVAFNAVQGLLYEFLAETLGIRLSLVFLIAAVISLLFSVSGTALLIWAVVARRQPAQPQQQQQQQGWQQPAANWQQPQPGWNQPAQPGWQPPQQSPPGWQPPQQPPGWQPSHQPPPPGGQPPQQPPPGGQQPQPQPPPSGEGQG
ncbi:hypothetical protein [Nonomuraea sp. NPDC002799]